MVPIVFKQWVCGLGLEYKEVGMRKNLRSFWEAWKRFGRFIGNIVGRILMTIFYFTLFAPFGIGATIFSDPLHIKTEQDVFWIKRQTGDKSLDDVKLQS
jgi:hypothetical protein